MTDPAEVTDLTRYERLTGYERAADMTDIDRRIPAEEAVTLWLTNP